MLEEMQFPDTLDEFIEQYSFIDKEEIYTNGSELIPTFRIKQYEEHRQQERNNYKELYEKEKEKNEILGQTIVGQQHTIRLLKKHKREQKHNHKIENKKVKHNWNELKEWLKEQDVFITELPVFTKEISIEHKTMSICYENILDKMQEIERL